MFTVGTKVVCCDDRFPEWVQRHYTALPKKDSIYVVRSVSLGVNYNGEPGEVAVRLVGLTNPKSGKPPHAECAFNSERFRPLLEREDWQTALDSNSDCIAVDA